MNDQRTTSKEKPPISIAKRLFIGGSVLILVLVAVGIKQRYRRGSQAQGRLGLLLSDLDETDPGWRLEDLERARPTLTDPENSALVVRAAHKLKPPKSPDNTIMERFAYLPAPPELLDAERAALLAKELKAVAPTLAEALKLADMPNGRHEVVYVENPYAILLMHAQEAREIAALLHYEALNLAQQGKAREALRCCQAALNAGRSLDDEPFMIAQLVRNACVALAADGTERTLALGEPPVEDLARMQALLELEEAHPTALVGLRGERAMMHAFLNGLADGSIPPSTLLDRSGGQDWLDRFVVTWDAPDIARRDHPKIIELMSKAIDNARLPLHEQGAANNHLKTQIDKLGLRSPLLRLTLLDTIKFAEATRRKLAQLRCLKTVLAVERFRREKGAWPAKLEDLTPKLLKKAPLDPYDGKSLRFVRVADGLVVYSVGPDEIDNGGALDRTKPNAPGTDVGYQLWDVKHRRKSPPVIPPMGK
jgi:hypothetical protein